MVKKKSNKTTINKKIMLSPLIFAPKHNKNILHSQFYTEAVWFKLTNNSRYYKMNSVEMLNTDQFEKYMFYGESEYLVGDKTKKTCIIEGTEVTYSEYIKSEAWKKKAKQRKELDNYKCVKCGKTHPIEVHHLNYDTLGHEDMDSLISLCSYCHYLEHK